MCGYWKIINFLEATGTTRRVLFLTYISVFEFIYKPMKNSEKKIIKTQADEKPSSDA